MYAKFKWDFLNGKSKSHIDLTVGFNCIVCHIFKLFTNQHFNYCVCWQALGQIKPSILKCRCKVCYPETTRVFAGSGGMKGWGRSADCSRERLGAAGPGVQPPGAPAPAALPPVALLVRGSASPWSCNWVSFEADLFLIRGILPFMCLSPGCQVLFTWTVCSPRVPRPPPLLRYGDISRNLTQPWPRSAAFCPAFSRHPRSLPGYRQAVPRKVAVGCLSVERICLFYKYSVLLLKESG